MAHILLARQRTWWILNESFAYWRQASLSLVNSDLTTDEQELELRQVMETLLDRSHLGAGGNSSSHTYEYKETKLETEAQLLAMHHLLRQTTNAGPTYWAS